MPKYVHVVAHLTPDELEQRYRKADDPVERSHLQIVWLLARGKCVREVAGVTGYCANWIRIVARRYNQHGPAVLADQRQHNKGAPSLLTGEHQQQLQRVASRKLQLMAACGLAQRSESRMGGRTGRTIHPQRGWEYLKRLGFSPQVEVWARKGHRPLIRVQQRYEWLYVYGFLHPETGASQWLLLPSVNIEVFSLALAHFAQAVSAGSDRHVVLVLDQAGWHKSGEVLMPEGIHLLFLPPYSPELQPCEHLWPLTNEVIANRRFESLDELRRGCKPSGVSFLLSDPLRLRRHTLFHWWPLSGHAKQT